MKRFESDVVALRREAEPAKHRGLVRSMVIAALSSVVAVLVLLMAV